jgi:hypothetical protein
MGCDWAADLADLRWHWGGAYRISYPAPGVWIAQRRNSKGTLRAATPEALLTLIRDDYARQPVPRNCAPGAVS